jgi:hypothetical protein
MNFTDIYRFANGLERKNTPFRALSERIVAFHPHVGEIALYPCKLDTSISLGHIVYDQDRTSPYNGTHDVAIICFSDELNRCWQRLVCTKELMHVFDGTQGRTNSRDRFITLLAELETAPRYEDASAMFKTERDALWKAILVLCPERLHRQYIKPGLTAEEIGDVAQSLRVPVQAVRAIASPYYQTALENLTGEVP